MEFIILAGGVIAGVILDRLLEKRIRTCGIIEIDHHTEQCKVHITSADLSDRKTKKAIFLINHDVKISREEQML